jgi:hypothetical protein
MNTTQELITPAQTRLTRLVPEKFEDESPCLSMLLILAFVLCAILPWWNRYIAVTNDGWHHFFAQQILAGKAPYRDFYYFVPPLYALKNMLLISVFGNLLLLPHLLAIAEIMVLAVVLVAWIGRVFPLADSVVAVTTALALYIFGMNTETLGGLHQEAIFFPVLAGWAASSSLRRPTAASFAFAGVLAGLSLLAKQTSGVATLAGLGCLLPALLWRQYGMRKAISSLSTFAAAATVPVVVMCIWLAKERALGAFVASAFVKGTSSKGSLAHIVFRPMIMIAEGWSYRLFVLTAIALLAAFFWFVQSNHSGEDRDAAAIHQNSHVGLFFLASLVALALGVVLSKIIAPTHSHMSFWNSPKELLMFGGEIGCFILFVLAALKFRGAVFTNRHAQLFLMSGFGSGLAYALGCSWVDYEPMVLPSLAVVLGFVLYQLNGNHRLRRVRSALIAACLLFIAEACMLRMNTPYLWGGWQEPTIWSATQNLAEPELAGFRVSRESAHFVDRITEDLVANSAPDDPVFVYPDLPIFYELAHRSPATFAYVHYIDVAPDFVDHNDAINLLRYPPRVIVYWDQTAAELSAEEHYFRNGKPSGVRDLVRAINELKPQYRIVDTFHSITGDRFVVMVLNAE